MLFSYDTIGNRKTIYLYELLRMKMEKIFCVFESITNTLAHTYIVCNLVIQTRVSVIISIDDYNKIVQCKYILTLCFVQGKKGANLKIIFY